MCLYQGERRLSRRRPLIRLLKGCMRDLVWVRICSQTFDIHRCKIFISRFVLHERFFFRCAGYIFLKSPITPPPNIPKKVQLSFPNARTRKETGEHKFFFLFFLGRVQFSLPHRRFLFKAGLR